MSTRSTIKYAEDEEGDIKIHLYTEMNSNADPVRLEITTPYALVNIPCNEEMARMFGVEYPAVVRER